jgi:uncharacterized Fe-S center protein
MTEQGSPVHFADLSADRASGVLEKITVLLRLLGLAEEELDRRLVAVKMHFGEQGNNAYIRPIYIARIVSFLAERGARTFLTDTNTLYAGSRGDSVSHWWTAVKNGFDASTVGAPVVIAGGMKGTRGVPVKVKGKHFGEVEIAAELLEADVLIGATHFKGHEMSGFGGTLKNFGMGAASLRGKLAMHSRVKPRVERDACTGCRLCLRWCAHGALVFAGGATSIDDGRCVGCGLCLPVCPVQAIKIVWNEQTADMQEKMAEYACGALRGHLPDRACFFNFVMQVSPLCDCYPFAGAPVVPDLGILASRDPVALDQASVDLVNALPGLAGSALPASAHEAGSDKFRALHPKVDWEIQLRHAESLGLGSRRYALHRV